MRFSPTTRACLATVCIAIFCIGGVILVLTFYTKEQTVDLAVWGAWSPCTVSCGSGNQERIRTCSGSQSACKAFILREAASCNGDIICPVHGNWGEWAPWKACSKSCGGGVQSKTRECSNPAPSDSGQSCRGADAFTRPCGLFPCPVDGQWAEWNLWGACSATCEPAEKSRERTCDQPEPQNGGERCHGFSKEYAECTFNTPCPIHGIWANWTPWEACDALCGPGKTSRTRTCTNPAPQYLGNPCEDLSTEEVACQMEECPVNGVWGLWDAWSVCSEVCTGGVRSRKRRCDSPSPAHGGTPCPTDGDREEEACNEGPCPVYGQWSGWSQWTICTVTCGTGTQERDRTCTNPEPKHGGNYCFGGPQEARECTPIECPIDGGWSAWLAWTVCSRACEGGMQSAVRECTNPVPQYGGEECPIATIYREQVCNTHKCPIHGGWTEWTGWSTCTKTCGTGTQSADRYCTNPEKQYGGDDCAGVGTKSQDCATYNCPVNGNWGPWDPWAICSASCAGGTQTTFRFCVDPAPQYGGAACSGISTKDQTCNTQACPIDGGWGAWGAWGTCSLTCATGTQSSSRLCDSPIPQHGGIDCKGASTRSQDCNQHINCPVHGGWSAWSATPCTASCEGGTLSKSRLCNSPSPLHGGTPCTGPTSDSGDCNTHPCPIDGQWTLWGAWGGCTLTCGGGTKYRARSCTNPAPQYYGLDCPGSSSSSTPCNTQTCPGGPLQRMRTVTGSASHSGMDDDVYIELWNANGGHCTSSWLDSPGDTFEGTDDFTSFGGCDGFMLTASTTGRMTHKGSDGWYVGSITLYSTWGKSCPAHHTTGGLMTMKGSGSTATRCNTTRMALNFTV